MEISFANLNFSNEVLQEIMNQTFGVKFEITDTSFMMYSADKIIYQTNEMGQSSPDFEQYFRNFLLKNSEHCITQHIMTIFINSINVVTNKGQKPFLSLLETLEEMLQYSKN